VNERWAVHYSLLTSASALSQVKHFVPHDVIAGVDAIEADGEGAKNFSKNQLNLPNAANPFVRLARSPDII
jgi:hypothetical protein